MSRSVDPIPDASAPTRPPDGPEIAAAFGLGAVRAGPVAAARGALGRIWRLETDTGTWAVKEVFWPEPDAAERARADVAFQEAALAAGVPMPRPIPARDGQVLIEVGPADRRLAVRVYSWVDLRGRDAPVPALEVAAILGRLHGLAIPDRRPIIPWFREPIPADAWPGLVTTAREAGAPWLSTLEAMLPDVIAGGALGVPPPAASDGAGPITCHLDLNPENVLIDAAGRVVIVDWENAGPAFAEQELASAVSEFVADPRETAAFLGAYEAAGGTARLHGRSSFGMVLLVQGRLVDTYARRALNDAMTDEDRAVGAAWIDEIAAHLVTLDRVDAWLAAAQRAGLLGRP